MLQFAFALILAVNSFGLSFHHQRVAGSSLDHQPRWYQNECDINDSGGVWSPDGTSIAFMSSRSGNIDIWVMGADGSNPQNLTDTPEAADYNPAWSTDGRQLVYSSTYELSRSDIWLVESDGSNPQNLTSGIKQNGYFFNTDPVWSPDGNFIAFSASGIEEADIMVVDMRDFSITNITADTNAVFIAAAWLSDSQYVAMTSADIDNPGLWVANRDGSGAERIVAQHVDTISGSPVQNIIAFGAGNFPAIDEGLNIYLIDREGRNAVDLTKDLVQFEIYPVWSPDGNQIAFQALSGSGNNDIWVISANGTGLNQLTTDDAYDIWPRWSPDGRHLTFTSGRDDKADVWVMDADGTNQINLTGKTDCNR